MDIFRSRDNTRGENNDTIDNKQDAMQSGESEDAEPICLVRWTASGDAAFPWLAGLEVSKLVSFHHVCAVLITIRKAIIEPLSIDKISDEQGKMKQLLLCVKKYDFIDTHGELKASVARDVQQVEAGQVDSTFLQWTTSDAILYDGTDESGDTAPALDSEAQSGVVRGFSVAGKLAYNFGRYRWTYDGRTTITC
jgi:hypothetical protein